MSIYYDESGMEKPPTVFTEFAGGILDSYYLRMREVEKEVEELREQKQSLEYDNSKLVEDRKKWIDIAETRKEVAGRSARKTDQLQNVVDEKVLHLAKQEKVIEQYAAWRVAVREIITGLEVRLSENDDNPLIVALAQISYLTKVMETIDE